VYRDWQAMGPINAHHTHNFIKQNSASKTNITIQHFFSNQ
jgi:hypothetical protein